MFTSFKKVICPLLCCLLWTNSSAAEDTIKIGIAGPLSGAYAAFGEQLWRGAVQAADDINDQGGVNGKRLVLIKADDACTPPSLHQPSYLG